MTPAGFPHSDTLGSQLGWQLPEAIAASYVLHRLLVPRHPPCALTSLATKMLASTVQFSRCGRSRSQIPPPATSKEVRYGERSVLSVEKRRDGRDRPAPFGLSELV